MKTNLTLLAAFCLCNLTMVNAQTVKDALIISQEFNGGTARFKGMGNASSALGGDISSISGNPAGLGFFGQSDISITGNLLSGKNSTNYFGDSNSKTKNNFGIDNAGVVFHFPTYKSGGNLDQGWINFNIGASYDKVNNFTNQLLYSGTNNSSTIVQSYTDLMADFQDWEEDFKNSNLVEQYADANNGYFPLTGSISNKYHSNQLIESGNKSRSNISFGGNYSNKFYFGLSVGFTSLTYNANKQFSEEGWTVFPADVIADNPNSDYADPTNPKSRYLDKNYLLYDDYNLATRGSGYDFKFGFIYKPKEDWNLGLTIQSPTWMTINEEYYTNQEASFYENEQATSAFDTFYLTYDTYSEYNIRTPFKFNVGATKFFNRGLITADAEFVDYGSTKISYFGNTNRNEETLINEDIKNAYKPALNVKLGGEMLFNAILSGRAGLNYYGNPYKNADQTQWNGSVGLGVKLTNAMYLDLAVVHSMTNYNENPYLINEDFWGVASPDAEIKLNRTNAVMTLGVKF